MGSGQIGLFESDERALRYRSTFIEIAQIIIKEGRRVLRIDIVRLGEPGAGLRQQRSILRLLAALENCAALRDQSVDARRLKLDCAIGRSFGSLEVLRVE